MITSKILAFAKALGIPDSFLKKQDVDDDMTAAHEIAHWIISTPSLRRDSRFGLAIAGPGSSRRFHAFKIKREGEARVLASVILTQCESPYARFYNYTDGPRAFETLDTLAKRKVWPPHRRYRGK